MIVVDAGAVRDNVSSDDASYVALAEALGCSLVTRDRRLATAVDGLIAVEAF